MVSENRSGQYRCDASEQNVGVDRAWQNVRAAERDGERDHDG